MKFDNNNLLEQIIRDGLFEETSTIKLIPWIGNKLSREGSKYVSKYSKYNLNSRADVSGFTIKQKNSTEKQIIDYIRSDKLYGKSSNFANGDFVYITQQNLTESTIDVVIVPYEKSIVAESDFILSKIRQFTDINDKMVMGQTDFLWNDKVKNIIYNPDTGIRELEEIEVIAYPFYKIGESYLIPNDRYVKREQKLNTDKQILQRLQRETELGVKQSYLNQEKEDSVSADDVVPDIEKTVVDQPQPPTDQDNIVTPVLPIEIQYPINRNSDSEIIRKLQQEIISMINNNPEIYPDPGTTYRTVFDRFIKTYGADGKWGTNTNNMIKLINVGFNDTESSSIDKATYDLIRKYQTEKIEL